MLILSYALESIIVKACHAWRSGRCHSDCSRLARRLTRGDTNEMQGEERKFRDRAVRQGISATRRRADGHTAVSLRRGPNRRGVPVALAALLADLVGAAALPWRGRSSQLGPPCGNALPAPEGFGPASS